MRSLSRKRASSLACLVCIGMIAWATATACGSEPRYNVLMIVSDDLSAEALACYGNSQCRTPNIDALSESGLTFTRAYCQFPVCGPSRAAMMAGTYAQCVGVVGNGTAHRFTDWLGERPSLPQWFRQHGWHATRISKIYHMRVPGDLTKGVAGPDHAASWDETWNARAPEWMSLGEHKHLTNESLNFDPDKHYNLGFGGAFYVVKGADPTGAMQADVMAADQAIQALERDRDRPFFLAVGLVRPHVPLVAPQAFFAPYPPQNMKLAEVVDGDWNDIPARGISKNSAGSGLDSPEEKQEVLSAYYACVEFMDAQVGKILQKLDELQLRDKTIVVFTSDHGYHLGEHELWQKMSLHEESTRIPLIVSVPGKQPARSPSLVQQIDLFPTLADLNELGIPPHVQGKSLAPLFDNPSHDVHPAVYCLRGQDHLIRTTDWAYLKYRDGSAELYDMLNDPQQLTNLIDAPEHASTRERLEEILAEKLSEIEAAKLTPDGSAPQESRAP